MKQLIKIKFAALILCCANIYGQKVDLKQPVILNDICFTYDNSGNRIIRSYGLIVVRGDNDDDDIDPKSSELPNEENTTDNFSQNREIHVYPNPVREELMVEISNGDEQENYRVHLYDSAGKLLKEGKRTGNGSGSVDFNSYPSGTYLLIINAGNEKFQFKIIKED